MMYLNIFLVRINTINHGRVNIMEDKYKLLEKLEEELIEARRTIDTAVWPNINDAMDFEHVHNLSKQIDEVWKEIKENGG
tara:strand:+ start:317 stop:556 length:240 start_codon:yes stop_codon:yes gene_type:complete